MIEPLQPFIVRQNEYSQVRLVTSQSSDEDTKGMLFFHHLVIPKVKSLVDISEGFFVRDTQDTTKGERTDASKYSDPPLFIYPHLKLLYFYGVKPSHTFQYTHELGVIVAHDTKPIHCASGYFWSVDYHFNRTFLETNTSNRVTSPNDNFLRKYNLVHDSLADHVIH